MRDRNLTATGAEDYVYLLIQATERSMRNERSTFTRAFQRAFDRGLEVSCESSGRSARPTADDDADDDSSSSGGATPSPKKSKRSSSSNSSSKKRKGGSASSSGSKKNKGRSRGVCPHWAKGQVLNKPGCRNSGSDCTSGRHSFQGNEKREAIKKFKK